MREGEKGKADAGRGRRALTAEVGEREGRPGLPPSFRYSRRRATPSRTTTPSGRWGSARG